VLRVNTAEQKKLCLYTGSSFPIRYINFKINFNFDKQPFLNPQMLKVILVTFLLKVGVKLIPRGISACRLARNKTPKATHMFSGLKISMVLSVSLPNEVRKSEIQDGGWNVVITRISANIHDSNTILKVTTRFKCHKTRSKNHDAIWCMELSKSKDRGHWPGLDRKITYISARIHDSNGIQTATPMFPGSDNRSSPEYQVVLTKLFSFSFFTYSHSVQLS